MEPEFISDTVRQSNRKRIQQDTKCQLLIDEIKAIEEFVSSFGYLQSDSNLILCKTWPFSLQALITSVEFTTGNIIMCCEHACIADANTLLRKYRDDLFFYLYIVVYDSNRKLEPPFDTTRMEENISRWIQNGLDNLYIQDVLRAIGTSPLLKDAVATYKLKKSFDAIGNRLNNFVHGNGYAYYNRVIEAYKNNEFYSHLKALLDDLKYMTITFLFLHILCSPISVMSTDYIDYLDFGKTPPEDSQYWVAPFIEQFISENSNLIDDNCYKYLLENTSMQFNPL